MKRRKSHPSKNMWCTYPSGHTLGRDLNSYCFEHLYRRAGPAERPQRAFKQNSGPATGLQKKDGPRTDPQMHTWDRSGSAIARTEPHRASRLAMAPQTRYARSHLAASCMSCTGPLCAKPPCIATSYARSHLEAKTPFTSDPCCSFDCFKGWV